MTAGYATEITAKTQITAAELPFLLDYFNKDITTLSLDCFDTLIWRQTAAPKDVFYAMQHRPAFQELGVTAYQRISAAARAYRLQHVKHGNHQIYLADIYKQFTALSHSEQNRLIHEEMLAEMEKCYAYPYTIELVRKAIAKGLKIVIVSDTYFTESQLHALLEKCLPSDVMQAITAIFCSVEFGTSKQDGLFNHVLQKLNLPAQSILHVGDHHAADFLAPQKMGLQACHFLQFTSNIQEFLRLQNAAASVSFLSEPGHHHKRMARFSPFRGLFSSINLSHKPENVIGYQTFGPMLYAFAKFLCDDIEALKQAGKKPKIFFLLRDAHLLARASEAYTGKTIGKEVRIRKLLATAAHFYTREDVDHYLSSLTSQYYDFWVVCEQLLLPQPVATSIIQHAMQAPHPEKKFNELIHQDVVLQFVFQQSTALRERLMRYIKKEMQIEKGDTVVLVDTGYIGLTQQCLARILQQEMNVEVIGRYFIASHEPNRPPSNALMTSTACDHGLFEQACTYKEGTVLDYDVEGNPVFDKIRLSDEQYYKVQLIQDECLRFIYDAKQFFKAANVDLPLDILQAYAIASLKRHMYFPMQAEVTFFQTFQHDKDLGPTLNKTMFNLAQGYATLHQNAIPAKIAPYEQRAASLEISLSALLQRSLDLEFMPEDMSLRTESLNLIIMKDGKASELKANAHHTHDGYFTLYIPSIGYDQIGIQFGAQYKWLEIENLGLLNSTQQDSVHAAQNIGFNHMNKCENLFECTDKNSMLVLNANKSGNHALIYQVTFRPVVRITPVSS